MASSGTLTNDGFIYAFGSSVSQGFGLGGPLTVAPASYTQSDTGSIDAQQGGTLTLAPTGGAAAFTNLSNGTLSGGFYGASEGGTLELPGSLTAIEQATVLLAEFSTFYPGGAEIEVGGTAIQAELTTIGTGALLELNEYDYETANTLTLNGGSIDLGSATTLATLDPAKLVLADSSSELSGAGQVGSDVDNNGTILAADGVLSLLGAVTGSGNVEIAEGATLELVQGGRKRSRSKSTTPTLPVCR
ncbi:MAG: hypothetical protein JO047_07960 [Alphaproteobacteria bacterium]|nr:hypothetical protein [Alphaproteobacteria bacterium]